MQRTWWPEAGTFIVTGPYSETISNADRNDVANCGIKWLNKSLIRFPAEYSFGEENATLKHMWPLLLSWFIFNPSMDM